jgi:hypothetical protein
MLPKAVASHAHSKALRRGADVPKSHTPIPPPHAANARESANSLKKHARPSGKAVALAPGQWLISIVRRSETRGAANV